MRFAVKFAYDGKHFSGYARQPGQQTIEQTLLDLLIKQGIFDDARISCFRTASRTDRGVSALGNVCAFDTTLSKDEIITKLAKGTSDVFIYGIKTVDCGFYPRHAKRREYRYYLSKHGLDMDRVLSAAGLFTGLAGHPASQIQTRSIDSGHAARSGQKGRIGFAWLRF